jgi:alpha-L-fucosidase 2
MTGTPVSRRALLGGALASAAGVATFGGYAAWAALSTSAVLGLTDTMTSDAAWYAFLGPLDPVWNSVPTSFYQGAFLGNGGLGAAAYQTGTAKRLSWKLGDSRVRDHQGTGGTLFGNARLPIGELMLDTAGDVTDVDLRLSLWHAELSGTVTTTQGVLGVRAYAHAKRDALVVAATVLVGTERVAWKFTPAAARSPRLDFKPAPDGLLTNPDPVVTLTSDGGTCVQDLAAGGRTTTQWKLRTEADGRTRTLLATVAHTYPTNDASTVAAQSIADADALTLGQLTDDHRSWWHAFYPKSFLSVPDTRLQSFYWIQLYKMASATRRDRPVLGTCGPWLEKTPWPGTWWNLNVQLEYWLINATGHTELDSLSASLDRYRANLADPDTPSQYRSDSLVMARTTQEDLISGPPALPGAGGEVGNLTWALHNAYLSYRHGMDDTVLRDLVFPLLRKAVNFYLHFLTKDSAGVYHLPSTYSPEYASTRDCNYDLALIHWGCGTLLAANNRLGLADPLAATWTDVRDHLVKPPQDSTNGMWIGADVQLTSSHRHYSHLLWFYPLYRLNVVTSSANRTLLTNSLNHWLGFTGALKGYTFTGSGSMYAALGNGDKARTQLVALLDQFVQPNTMYAEAGPVIETPLSGAQTMHDMLVQSWGGVIRVFPAVPGSWSSVTVHNLRTEGGFVVSAARRGGTTQFIRINSLAGEPCRVHPGNLPAPYQVRSMADGSAVPFTQNSDGTLTVTLAKGADALVTTQGAAPDLTVAPVGSSTKAYWGLPPGSAGRTVDLSALYTVDGVSSAAATTDGNFDGSGYTYPAEEMPSPGLFVNGDVAWKFPGYADGQRNAVVPSGQTLTVPSGTYQALHVLGAGVGGNASGTLTLRYSDGSSGTATLALSDWGRAPAFGERVGVYTSHRHGPLGDDPLPVRMWHQRVAVDATRTLTSVVLPSASHMRIVALTVA